MLDLQREVPITCHKVSEVFAAHLRNFEWRPGHDNKAYGGVEPWRTCNYCGSMHPLDLFGFMLKSQVDMHGADWKYGWPHKFYVDVPNPHEGKLSVAGGMSGGYGQTLEQMQTEHPDYENWRPNANGGWEADCKPTPAPTFMHGKFYNEHLNDLTDEELECMGMALATRAGIYFWRENGLLWYSAPRAGYQALGEHHRLFEQYIKEGMDVLEAMSKAARDLKAKMQREIRGNK